jgi:hypothetical protein
MDLAQKRQPFENDRITAIEFESHYSPAIGY